MIVKIESSINICELPFEAVKVKSLLSTSLADNSITRELSSSIIWLEIAVKIGLSFTELILTLKLVLTLNLPTASLAVTTTSPWPKASWLKDKISRLFSIEAVNA